jgi:hypothetical protein
LAVSPSVPQGRLSGADASDEDDGLTLGVSVAGDRLTVWAAVTL